MKRLVILSFVLLVCMAAPTHAVAQPPSHGWLSLDSASSRAAQDPQSFSAALLLTQELASGSVAYSGLDDVRTTAFDGGLIAWRGLGCGVRVDSVNRSQAITVSASIPDPLIFSRNSTGHVTQTLDRKEHSVDIMAAYVVPIRRWVGVRVFAGPSRVQLTQSFVSRFTYAQFPFPQPIAFPSVTSTPVTTNTWGSHAGFDLGFYPQRNIGIGINILRRQVDIPAQTEPFSGRTFVTKADATTIGVGARLRF